MSARSLNRVTLIGNLTRDPELRYTPQGTAVCTFGVATNRSWTPSDGGERQEEVEFHRIVAWAKLAEICSQILHKGRKVYVEGRLQTRTWTGQDEQERTTTEIVIDSMIALGPPKPGTAENSGNFDDVAAEFAEPATSTKEDAVSSADDVAVAAPKVKQAPTTSSKSSKAIPTPKASVTSAKKEKEDVSEDDIPF